MSRALLAALAKPALPGVATIAITTTWAVGNTITVSQGAGGPVTHYKRYIGGVDQGDTFVGPTYTITDKDCGPLFSCVPVGPGGSGAESNRIKATWLTMATVPDALYDRQNLTLVSTTHVSAQGDSSGHAHTTMAQGTDANRPLYGPLAPDNAPGYINGIYGIVYDGNGLWMAGPTVANLLSDSTKFWMLAPLYLANVAHFAATNTTIYNGRQVIGTDDRHIDFSYYTVAGVPKAGFWATAGVLLAAQDNISVGSRLVRTRKNGTTVGIIVDGATEQTAIDDNAVSPTTSVLRFGWTGFGNLFAGAMGDIAIWNTPPSANMQATAAAFAAYTYSMSESSWS